LSVGAGDYRSGTSSGTPQCYRQRVASEDNYLGQRLKEWLLHLCAFSSTLFKREPVLVWLVSFGRVFFPILFVLFFEVWKLSEWTGGLSPSAITPIRVGSPPESLGKRGGRYEVYYSTLIVFERGVGGCRSWFLMISLNRNSGNEKKLEART